MSHERQRRLMELLEGALELPESERFEFLEAQCDDEKLRDEVYGLLETRADDSSGPLGRPAFDLRADVDESARANSEIGPYRIVRLLERGGMGSVYLAERADFEKQVALKVIRRGLDLDDLLVRRFHNERQILARLEHPHIARLHDGGTTDDQLPYFVMEYVEGEPIDRYCKHRNLSVDEILSLFRKVCRAVQFAHQNLIVHRDLKPGNILIGEDGEPKLLDFGIAKLLDQDLADQTVVTGTREGLMTPRYASPEQITGDAITTASDIYSLGVLLFELLAGVGPYRLETSRGDELARAVCDQPAERPSTAVRRRKEQADSSPEEDRHLIRRLRGDLDEIVLKALRKRPDERYGSVRELEEDLRRHLEGLPVEASTGAWTYRARKFVRRHWLGVAVVASYLVLVSAFGVASLVLLNQAESAEEQTETITKFLVELLYPAREAGASTTEEKIRRFAEEQGFEWIVDSDIDPGSKVGLLKFLGKLHLDANQLDDAELVFRKAVPIADAHYGPDHDETLTCKSNLASVDFHRGDFKDYREQLEQILATRLKMGHKKADIWTLRNNIASSWMIQGEFSKAETEYEAVLEERRLRYERNPDLQHYLARSHQRLGSLYRTWGKPDRARFHAERALEFRGSKSSPERASTLDLIGRIEMDDGYFEESEKLLKQALNMRLGIRGLPSVSRSYLHLSELSLLKGDHKGARDYFDKAQEHKPHSEQPWERARLNSLEGALEAAEGRCDEALPKLADAFDRLEKIRGSEALVTLKAKERLEKCSAAQASVEP